MPRMHWPFGHKAPAAPAVVTDMVITGEGGVTVNYPQYWDRNTLIIDLQGLSGAGSAVAKPRAGTAWPPRLVFRVTPGQIGELQVKGEQRHVFSVPSSGAKYLDLALGAGAYTTRTTEITITWGAGAVPAS